eukprot:CAMPEP_0197447012 /NCGR_PEP_ID=MMETSP1175-20131217/11771_1 /TAXON_ID=1003142 /ORGANISM="Triceratium dubium, Strain CCMP147" /LENGTH=558 /DNA_ID=CAMNT_0042978193 /DNA_START=155 /DNA_END=1831 /DNA_ORIENTATION=+
MTKIDVETGLGGGGGDAAEAAAPSSLDKSASLQDGGPPSPQTSRAAEDGGSPDYGDDDGVPPYLLALLGTSYASPLPPATYWIETLGIAAQSALLGLFSLGFLNAIYEVPKLWLTMGGDSSYPDDPSTTAFLAGNPWWVGIGALTGLIVGILKGYVFKFDTYTTFMEELLSLETEGPREAVGVTLTCLISVLGGASLGPESGLGSACTAMSAVWARGVNWVCGQCCGRRKDDTDDADDAERRRQRALQQKEDDKVRSKLFILSGMVAAFSTILPSPASAILLCIEVPSFERLSKEHNLPYIKTVSQLTVSGLVSYLVFEHFKGQTYIPPVKEIPGFVHEYTNTDLLLALGFGTMGAALGLCYFVIAGLTKALVRVLRTKLEDRFGKKLRIVVLCLLGGTIYGALGYIFPLTLGSGEFQFPALLGYRNSISTPVLVASTFAKMLTFHVSNESGLVGGLFLPLLIMSTFLTRVFVNELGAAWAPSMACGFVALAAAFVPAPLTLVVCALSQFNLGSRGSITLLVCVVTAHVLFVGSGLLGGLLDRAAKRRRGGKRGGTSA